MNATAHLSKGLRWAAAVAAIALACPVTQTARAQLPSTLQDYRIQVLEPPSRTVWIDACNINEKGFIVLQYHLADDAVWGQGHSAILDQCQWKNIDVPGALWTGASIPSSAGRIGLTYVFGDGVWHAALYQRGRYTPLPAYTPVPGEPAYQYGLQSVCDHDLMSAMAFDPADPARVHGVLLNSSLSLFKVFDPPEASLYPNYATYAIGLNNAGHVVVSGSYVDGNGAPRNHGFLYDGQNFTRINVPGSEDATGPYAINNRGEIVGTYIYDNQPYGPPSQGGGFILRKGEFRDFTMPDSLITFLCAINDHGQLSGVFVDGDINYHPFVATRIQGRR